jgi:signal transduction histidine kinase
MPGAWQRIGLAGALNLGLLLVSFPSLRSAAQSPSVAAWAAKDETTITNLAQLTHALSGDKRQHRSIRLEGVVCAARRPGVGVVVVQDDTAVELLELGRRTEEILPGDRIRIEGTSLLLRRRELGAQISAAPLIDNDGLHPFRMLTGETVLKAGRVPVEVDWFNCLRIFGLDVLCQGTNGQPQTIPASALWHDEAEPGSGGSSSAAVRPAPGLKVECYEGFWAEVPDLDLLQPVKTGTTTNFELGFRTRDELVGLRFTGYFDAPNDGSYRFQLGADDGALLFVGSRQVPVSRLGASAVPTAAAGRIGEPMNQLEERRWLAVEGRVSFISRAGEGLELELRSGMDTVWVKVADAVGLDPAGWLNSYVRAVGVGRAALSANQRIVLDRLSVASSRDLQRVEFEAVTPPSPLPLAPVSHVQTLEVEEAKLGLPVRVRGVITAALHSDHWCSLQDETRGIFVSYPSLTNSLPASGELWEVSGQTAPGNFAPIIEAAQMQRLGPGRMPEPDRPSWNELANGSMDVQWVEFHGVVSGVQSNRLLLLMPEGQLEVQMENYFEPELKPYRQAVVRIRGTLFAIWNVNTREVQFGQVLMRNARLSLEVPPPADPFNAPVKSPSDLLLFDSQATAFHPVKVRAQVLCADSQEVLAMDAGSGLRVLAADTATLRPGDWFEAVGYPEISGPSPLLRQALIRKTGTGQLPEARLVAGAELTRRGLDATLVSVEGKLIGTHLEQHSPVLEMQSAGQLFIARLKSGPSELSLRPGSQLRLSGVYVQTGRTRRLASHAEAFELLLNSPADIRVLSQPSWWTLERLGAVVGFLLVILSLAVAWITQLHRKVEQRTAQLQQEIRQRESAERQRAIEAERSRIAHDLHDDLGSGLTEISVLASTGQRRPGDGEYSTLFRNISAKARGLIGALEVIVWAVDPDDNSLQSLADYLSGFAGDFLAHSGLPCRFRIPVVFPPVILGGQVRHGVLMAVKESLNNIVRHAAATQVEFGMAVVDGALEIVITDDGKGFDASAGADRHGLKHLPARLAKLGGTCQVHSVRGEGTTVTIRLPLSAPVGSEARSTGP